MYVISALLSTILHLFMKSNLLKPACLGVKIWTQVLLNLKPSISPLRYGAFNLQALLHAKWDVSDTRLLSVDDSRHCNAHRVRGEAGRPHGAVWSHWHQLFKWLHYLSPQSHPHHSLLLSWVWVPGIWKFKTMFHDLLCVQLQPCDSPH